MVCCLFPSGTLSLCCPHFCGSCPPHHSAGLTPCEERDHTAGRTSQPFPEGSGRPIGQYGAGFTSFQAASSPHIPQKPVSTSGLIFAYHTSAISLLLPPYLPPSCQVAHTGSNTEAILSLLYLD